MDVYFQRNIIFLIFIRFSVSVKNYDDECNFAPSYNLDQLFASPELQHEFLMKATWWDGKFMQHGLGINAKSGLAHDGVFLNYDTGQPVMDTLFKFTNNEHEGLHLAILALTLDNNAYAVNFIRSSIEQTGGWNESVEAYVVDQLTRKISSYEHFNRTYPGFGGFFPFCDVQDDEMHPGPMVLQLLNYDTVWGLVAVSQVLRERSESNNALMELADRYQQYIDYLASTGLDLFFQPDKEGGIARDVIIFNATAAPGIHNNNSAPVNMIDDPWQLESRVMFFYLYADFSRFGGNKTRDLIWMNKRRKLVAVNFPSSDGNITVERGDVYAAIEKVKYSMLPYFDVSINERIFLNGERARTHFSNMHGIPGLFSHVSTYAAPKSYRTDDINSLYRYYGIDELSEYPVNVFAPNKSVTPSAAFTLLLHPLTRSHGVVWYAAMLQGSRMQGPIGSTDGVKVTGELIVPTLSFEIKLLTVIGICGGIGSITRRYMLRTHVYDNFVAIIEREWKLVFGGWTLAGEQLPFSLPSATLADNGARFSACPSLVTLENDDCNFAENYDRDTLYNSSALQKEFLMKAVWWDCKYMVNSIGIDFETGLTLDRTSVDPDSGVANYVYYGTSAGNEAYHLSLLAQAIAGNKYATHCITSSIEGVWHNSTTEYIIDQLTKKMRNYAGFNQRFPGYGGFLPWFWMDNEGMYPIDSYLDHAESDNGQEYFAWAILAVAQALNSADYHNLAHSYFEYAHNMASNGLTMFFRQHDNTAGFISQVGILNNTLPPTADNLRPYNGCNEENPCYLKDPWDQEAFVFFLYLFADWPVHIDNQTKDRIWENFRDFRQSAKFHNIDLSERAFLNFERARTQITAMNHFPGLTDYPPLEHFSTADYPNNISSINAINLLLHERTRACGIAWYATMLQGAKMQGPYGFSGSVNFAGDLDYRHSFWKMSLALAVSGGVVDLVREYLFRTGKYDEFHSIVARETNYTFPQGLNGENVEFALPNERLFDDGSRFSICRKLRDNDVSASTSPTLFFVSETYTLTTLTLSHEIASTTSSDLPIINKKSSIVVIGIISLVGSFTLLFVGLLFSLLVKKFRRQQFGEQKTVLRYAEKSACEGTTLSNLIANENITIDFNDKIGEGSSATVYSGHLKSCSPLGLHSVASIELGSFRDCRVAIKQKRVDRGSSLKAFHKEIEILTKVGFHQNIITFLGIVDASILGIVMELAEGNLLKRLKRLRLRGRFQLRFSISVAKQMASAMVHVSSLGLVHRDVAARNVLLLPNGTSKLSDFGLCCTAVNKESDIVDLDARHALPLRWLALESLTSFEFTEKSDVWSFGVLLYEIFSLGLEPYENMAAVDIKKHLEDGERLPRPHHSSDDIDELMRTCWHAKPRDRPSFVELHNRIDEMSTTVAADSYNYCDAESSLENLEL